MSKQNNQNNSVKNNSSGQQKSIMDRDYNPNKPKTSGGTKLYLAILALGLALAVGGIFYKNKNNNNEDIGNTVDQEGVPTVQPQPTVQINDNSNTTSDVMPAGNYIEGILERSDDSTKGNLKVVSGTNVTYLRTSRDFSSLIGSAVMVLIDGTLDNFKLVDIKAKVEKDGYIIPKN